MWFLFFLIKGLLYAYENRPVVWFCSVCVCGLKFYFIIQNILEIAMKQVVGGSRHFAAYSDIICWKMKKKKSV